MAWSTPNPAHAHREPPKPVKFIIGGRAVEIPRRVDGLYHLDSNRINSKQGLVNINRMEKWKEDGVILMELSVTAHRECATTPKSRRAQKANEYIYAYPADWQRDMPLLGRIERIIFPNGGAKDINQRRDVLIVYTASHYNAILVTADGKSKKQPRGILGSQADLQAIGVRVMSDAETVQRIEAHIADRDKTMRLLCQRYGQPLPDWVGKD